MFLMIFGAITGIVLGALILRFVPRKSPMLGWVVLGLGAVALIAISPILISILIPTDNMISPAFSIVAMAACLVSGIGAVMRQDRRWQVLLGLALGGVPLLFWLVFIAGEILYPH